MPEQEHPSESGGDRADDQHPNAPDSAEADSAVDHDDTGLDLARAAARAAAGAGVPAKRRRRGSGRAGDGKESGGRGRGTGRDRLGGYSGAHPDERDPQLLDGELGRLVGERGWALPLRVRGVFARWAEIVGAEIAEHAQPESFDDGRLVVRTASTAWATQLKLLAPTLVRRLNDELGDGTVTVVEVRGPNAPSWKKGLRSVRDGRGPRDTYG
ncbi:DUF721 domain-containing protein [Nocardioides sp. R-C-SC26]|uniref:DUF721 domain-containing protein n=1 Tax=Nocardioides sp. R-C-SC26 TaxID=2870414 RepID=UPI001E3C35AC|nr:DciA family protein [Nocardioides sp. R-C-SC26]